MIKKIQLLFNTIKYLKLIQILNRVKRKFIKPKVSLFNIPKNLYPINRIKPVIQCSQRMYDDSSFLFLNKAFTLKTSEDWNDKNQDKLWLYNLHYFDDLNSINSEQRIIWHNNLIQKWIENNPLGFGNGWEPYPSSLRIVNWIKWFLLDLNPINNINQRWLSSLVIQTRFLSQNLEYHLLGNHLFANAKALVFAGLFFDGEESNQWYQLGISIINRELSEQVLSDGGNFELSPMYHAIFLEDLLDLVNIQQAYGRSLPNNLENKIVQMLEWLKVMCHPDREIAFFNDSTLGIAPSFIELLSYSDRLGIVLKNNKVNRLTHLEESGYIRVEDRNMVIIADVANIGPDYMPGHGHADALSFELSLFGKRVIVNSGISTYEIGEDRFKQRGTELHSTINIDNQNSSEVWSGFRVANRAKIIDIKKLEQANSVKFSACHDGYKALKEGVLHCRNWTVSKNSISIIDSIIGNDVHKVRSVLPLHPNVLAGDVEDNSISLEIIGKIVKINFEGSGKLKIIESQYYPEFGCSINNKHLIYDYTGKLPSKITLRISW
jgi:uncharacterized heparinase superfamily protein